MNRQLFETRGSSIPLFYDIFGELIFKDLLHCALPNITTHYFGLLESDLSRIMYLIFYFFILTLSTAL